ncbi:hypothetical protein O6H91_20G039500 [Diphasiastrum complanatum]|uniref:Uncharacterized protein n=1 Tax=Diphasiastrum complanatum TaxID=34168 RepID=A0ACC2APM0_DIPCM|nr:hypothetical protein O6H91_20G039500 [Diphasiastrum complanatum]
MAASMRRRATVSLPAFAGHIGDRIIHNFNTYEDYLDSQITANDLFYLEDVDLARQLVELGYRSNAEIMTRDQFINLKEDAEQAHSQALAEREHIVRQGKMAVSSNKPYGHFLTGNNM